MKIIPLLILCLHLSLALASLFATQERAHAFLFISCPLLLSGLVNYLLTRRAHGIKKLLPVIFGLSVAGLYVAFILLFFGDHGQESTIGSAMALLLSAWIYSVFSVGAAIWISRSKLSSPLK